MHYYLYEIKNTVNGKIYIGVHKTKSLDDGYMGSGKVITRAIAKHGLENFVKTILETFDNPEAMFAREKEVVNDEFLARDDVYNLRRGGTGGFDYINKQGFSRNSSHFDKKNAASKKGGTSSKSMKVGIFDPLSKDKAVAKIKELFPNGTFFGKNHSETTITKMKAAHAGLGKGKDNSQFGSFWITDGQYNKKCTDINDMPSGWHKGRTVK